MRSQSGMPGLEDGRIVTMRMAVQMGKEGPGHTNAVKCGRQLSLARGMEWLPP